MDLWDAFLLDLDRKLGKEAIDTWVRSLHPLRFDAGNLYLEAKDAFQISWFEEHIRPLLSLKTPSGRPLKVHLSLKEPPALKSHAPSSAAPSFASSSLLDPEMRLDTFIVEEKNRLPFQIATELSFNPTYLFGPEGSGKTHLLQAIAKQAIEKGKKAFYVQAEAFTEHVVQAIRSGSMRAFREVYREIDLLCIDGIDLFSRKTATQEEFFHTFNTLHTTGKPIVLASRIPPSQLQEIEPRLTSRFEWGISLQLSLVSPSLLLEKKAALWNADLPDAVASFLLSSFSQPVRALQTLLLRHKGGPLTKASAEALLQDLLLASSQKALSPEKILTLVAEHFSLSIEEITGKGQAKELAAARQAAMYLCREKLKLPLQKIGALFNRDHSTVLSSIKKVERGIEAKDSEILSLLSHAENLSK